MKRILLAAAWLCLSIVALAQKPGVIGIPPAHAWALLIGAGKYTGLTKLKYAAGDATLMRDTLVGSFGFESSSVRLVTDEDAVGPQPTSDGIRKEISSLLADRNLDQGDLFVFYFSGHGIATPEGDYLCPVDADSSTIEAKGIPTQWLIDQFVSAGLKNVLVITDACREGTKNPFGQRLQDLGRRANIAVFLGCAPGAVSYEDPRSRHGVFTSSLCKELKDASSANAASGSVWASAIAAKVRADVIKRTQSDYGDDKQVPSAWADPGEDVLFGVRWASEDAFYAQVQTEAGALQKIDPKLVEKLISKAAIQAGSSGDYQKCIELFATLERLGSATPYEKMVLSLGYMITGRYSEAQRLLDSIVAKGRDTTIRDMALVYDRSPSLTPTQRGEAARRLFLAAPTSPNAEQYLADMELDGIGTETQHAQAKADVRKALDPSDWMILWMNSEAALRAQDWSKLVTTSTQELKALNGHPNKDRYVKSLKHFYEAVRVKGTKEQQAHLVKSALIFEPNDPYWRTQADLIGVGEPDKAKADFMARWKAVKLPIQRLEMLLTDGDYAGELLPDAAAMHRDNPSSYEAALLEAICLQATDWDKFVPVETFLNRAPDKAEALGKWAHILGSIAGALHLDGRMSELTYQRLIYAIQSKLPDAAYGQFLPYLYESRHHRTAAFRPEIGSSGYAMVDAIYRDDHSAMEKLAATSADNAIRLALHESLEGDYSKSATLISRLNDVDQKKDMARAVVVLNIYGLQGPKAGETAAADFHAADFTASFVAAYVLERSSLSTTLAVGEIPLYANEAEKLMLEMAQTWAEIGTGSPMPDYPDFTAACIQLSAEIRSRLPHPGLMDEESGIDFVKFLTDGLPYAPITRAGGKSADYAGSWSLQGTLCSLEQTQKSSILIEVKPSGDARATLYVNSSQVEYLGRVDDKGNLVAKNGQARLRCRLACEADVKQVPQWISVSYRIWLENGKGQEATFIGDGSLPSGAAHAPN